MVGDCNEYFLVKTFLTDNLEQHEAKMLPETCQLFSPCPSVTLANSWLAIV